MPQIIRQGSTLKLLLLFCGIIQESSSECGQDDHNFDYRERGPEEWRKLFPTCKDKLQSPIPLDTTDAIIKHSPALQWFNWHNVPENMSLENNGHSAMLTASWNSSEDVPYVFLSCPPCSSNLSPQYVFAQLHFHWGENDEEGSEHTLNKKRFPLEMHVVTFNKEFGDISSAISSGRPNAVAVVTYFFRIGDTLNVGLQDLVVSYLPDIRSCGAKIEIPPMKLHDLVPEFKRNFFMYNGTLTTPPCSRVAMFLISKEAQSIMSEQLPHFRCLLDINNKPLTRNYRDLQKLDGRKVILIL